MSRKNCKICQHPQSQEINKFLIDGVPLRKICTTFPTTTVSGLHRHRKNHLAADGKPTTQAADAGFSDMLAEVEKLLKKAKQANNAKHTINLLKEKRALLGEIQKTADRSKPTAQPPLKVAELQQWQTLRAAITAALQPYPDAAAAVAAALEKG